jgi:hypothetical protein
MVLRSACAEEGCNSVSKKLAVHLQACISHLVMKALEKIGHLAGVGEHFVGGLGLSGIEKSPPPFMRLHNQGRGHERNEIAYFYDITFQNRVICARQRFNSYMK